MRSRLLQRITQLILSRRLSPDLHMRPRHCNPFILFHMEPRESQIELPVQISMQAMREPPAPLIVTRAVGMTQIIIPINCAELHTILEAHRVTCVSMVTRQVQSVTFGARWYPKRIVLGVPRLPIDIHELDAKWHVITWRQSVQCVIADPEFRLRRAKARGIVVPLEVELLHTVVAALNGHPVVGVT